MGDLSVHDVDTVRGMPRADIKLIALRLDGDSRETVSSVVTNDNGRCNKTLRELDPFGADEYETRGAVGDYLALIQKDGIKRPSSPRFLYTVATRSSDKHYQMALSMSPLTYSTYLARIIHEIDQSFRIPFVRSKFRSVGNTVCIPLLHEIRYEQRGW